MKKHLFKISAVVLLISAATQSANAQQTRLANAKAVNYNSLTKLPNFIKFDAQKQIQQQNFVEWATYAFNLPGTSTFKPYNVEKDRLGFTHTRYKQYVNNFPVEGTMLITHTINGKIKSVNGDYFQNFSSATLPSLSEAAALNAALKKVSAKKYKWESKEGFQTYFPKGELVIVHKKGADYSASNMRLAYKFNIYADMPLYRANVFVDANNGEILDEKNLICTIDVIGTAATKFSGTVTMTSDSFATGQVRLRETGRGNGISTYNMNNTSTYSQTDFINPSSTWNVTNNDQAASDAHWGAEMTYDYYKHIHNRNSIDNAGYALNSYVHYNDQPGSASGYINAFWDGTQMTYGDGDISYGYLIMIALDVCGHEITHGLTSFTSGLDGGGAGEPDALNEGNSDIFGTTIEWYARPNQHDWIIASDLTCDASGNQDFIGFRDMSNPKSLGQPDCYLGTNWDLQGEPHNNNGPFIYWYYLLCQGGSGTNDLGNAWNVTGITMNEAKMIAFRQNTVYFTPSTTYNDARIYSLAAAADLFGACSTELQMTANAWYAVGVGAPYSSSGITTSFSNGNISSCSLPVVVQFNNASTNASSYNWTFGDGGTSALAAPSHSYTIAGTYSVQLEALACDGISKDSTTQIITISTSGAGLPFTEGFEGSTNLPSGWSTYNPDNEATWQITSAAAHTGTNCIGMNNCSGDGNNDMTGTIDRFYTKTYDFTTLSNAALNFDVAYTTITFQGTVYADTLLVYYSTDCGTTWTSIYHKGGTILATAPVFTGGSVNCWTPASTEWRTETINLSSIGNQPNVMFAFENRSDWGQWVYIDNINIASYTTTGIEKTTDNSDIYLFPNPAQQNITVQSNQTHNLIAILNTLGQTVMSFPTNAPLQNIDVSSLACGVYFVKIVTNDNSQKLIKFIKQ